MWWWWTLVHARKRGDDVLTVQHWVWRTTRVERDALPEAFYLVPQHFYLPRHVCMRLLHVPDEINGCEQEARISNTRETTSWRPVGYTHLY